MEERHHGREAPRGREALKEKVAPRKRGTRDKRQYETQVPMTSGTSAERRAKEDSDEGREGHQGAARQHERETPWIMDVKAECTDGDTHTGRPREKGPTG